MKKKILIISIVLISIILIFLMFQYVTLTSPFYEKIALLEDAFANNEEMVNLKNIQGEQMAIIAISDNKSPAIVKSKRRISIEKTYKTVKRSILKEIIWNRFDTEMVKIDFAKDLKKITYNEFQVEISKLANEYSFNQGIILKNSDEDEIVITEGELNSNNIINYDKCIIILDNLNNYLKKTNQKTFETLPEEIEIFSTISYFCDEENNIYEIDSETGYRKQEFNKELIDEKINNANSYLLNMIDDNGKYVYGYSPLTNTVDEGYNILRHAGTSWSLVEELDGIIPKHKEKVVKTLEYLKDTVKYSDSETGYIVEELDREIQLGGNGLAILAMSKYIEKFDDSTYLELIEKLGNGIISMQNEDGSYIHVLNADDFSKKSSYRTIYYDGEATFALCRLYGLTKNPKYLDAAQKAIQYFINNNYANYGDHWLSYTMNEITKYVQNEEYYELGLKNIEYSLNNMDSKTYTSHVNFEMLLQGFELYDRMLENNINVEFLNSFSAEKFFRILNDKAHLQLNSYLYPEIAMYLEVPEKYSDTFYIRHSDYRIRIDDIQHSILGYRNYYRNFEKIQKYLSEYEIVFDTSK